MDISPEEIERRLKRMEGHNKPLADKMRECLAASIVPPIVVDGGPFKGWIEVRIPLELPGR